MLRYNRLRAKGLLTAKEMSVRHGVTTTTIHLWAREGRLQKHRYGNVRRCLYEPLEQNAILKGRFPRMRGEFKCTIHEFEAGLETGLANEIRFRNSHVLRMRLTFITFLWGSVARISL